MMRQNGFLTKGVVLLMCLMALCVGFVNAGTIAQYDADAGTPIENPTVQGWPEAGIDVIRRKICFVNILMGNLRR